MPCKTSRSAASGDGLLRSVPAMLAVVLATTLASAAGAATEAGTVLTLRGDCAASAEGARRSLSVGAPVYISDTVETAVDARLKLRMVDGSVLSIASASKLTIADYGAAAGGQREVTLNLANGLLRAVVSKVTAPSRFEVDTASGVAAVRGTDWFVVAKPDAMQVGVLTGDVRLLSRATQHSVDIPAHWGARLEAGKDPVPPRRWQASEFDDVIRRTDIE